MLLSTTVAMTLLMAAPGSAMAAVTHKVSNGQVRPDMCEPESGYTHISNIQTSTRPTNVVSSYVEGPGTISYNRTLSFSASGTLSSSISASGGILALTVSAQAGVAVTLGASYSEGFTYSLEVPRGTTERVQLEQRSKSFYATRYNWNQGECKYINTASGSGNLPYKTQAGVFVRQNL